LNGWKPPATKSQAQRLCWKTCARSFAKAIKTHRRIANPSRHFFKPVESLLVDGAPEHENSGRILRGSLAAIWQLISQDLLPTMTDGYISQVRPLIASDNQPEIRKAAAAFQTKVVSYLDNVLGSPDGAARARTKLATYTASPTAYDDLIKTLSVLRVRDALAKFNEALPSSIQKFGDAKVLEITRLLHAFRKTHAEEIPIALALVANRLKIHWQLIRLATSRPQQERRGCGRHALRDCGPDGTRPAGRQAVGIVRCPQIQPDARRQGNSDRNL
jgi:hypothetical protein